MIKILLCVPPQRRIFCICVAIASMLSIRLGLSNFRMHWLLWKSSDERAAMCLRMEIHLTDLGKSTYTRWADVEVEKLSSLIGRQFLVGTDTMLARVLLKKGAHVPLHSHHNEQITYILDGALQFAIEGREIVVHAGEVLCIPPYVPHEAFALEDTVDLDIFSPPRQDWIDRDDAYLRGENASAMAEEG
jgi:quercetin dioxygenase-like cupin family protein